MGGLRAWCLAGALTVLAGGATAACATIDHSGTPVPQPTPAASMPSVGPSPHALGQRVDADHAFVEVTVYSYQQPVAQGAPAPNPGDYAWAAADVQTCASNSSIFTASVSGLNWELIYADGTDVEPARVTHPQFPKPLYPTTQHRLQPGECLRGWVVFPVPAEAKPIVVRYAPYGAPSVDWVAAPAS